MACYIYQLPSWVLDDLCRNIDTLSEWDWMQFGECDTAHFRPEPGIRSAPEAGGCLYRTLLPMNLPKA